MSDVLLEEQVGDGVVVVRLNRPDHLNAINAEMVEVEALHTFLGRVTNDSDVRAIVLTGSGRAFCAGLDLRSYGRPPGANSTEGRPQRGLRVQQHIADLGEAFRRTRAPIIGAINGPATGGGMALALLCDLRIASSDARMNAAMVKVGLSGCDIGLSWLLPRIVGITRAFELQLTGRFVDADEAERIGLVTSVHSDDQLLPAALQLAGTIVANSPFGIWMTKEVLWANLETSSFRSAIDLENRTQILASLTDDHREATAAFLEKRQPVFGNR